MQEEEVTILLVDGPAEGMELSPSELEGQWNRENPAPIRINATAPFSFMNRDSVKMHEYIYTHHSGNLYFYIHLPN